MKQLARVGLVLAVVLCTLPLLAEEATFDRTLNVSGPVDLEVVTGSGSITVRSGAAGTIRVHGTLRAGFCFGICGGGDPEADMKAIVANPPIEQSGNTVRIGHLGESQRHNNISISYELVVPADTKLLSKTGSGHQEISGVAGPAEVTSGSGSLRLEDIAGQVRANTGSGSITVNRLRGSVRAHTGSGSIRGEGGDAESPAKSRPVQGKEVPRRGSRPIPATAMPIAPRSVRRARRSISRQVPAASGWTTCAAPCAPTPAAAASRCKASLPATGT